MANLNEICLDAYTPGDKQQFLDLTASGAVSLFVYNNNLISEGKRERIDLENYKVRPEFRLGKLFAPITVFERFVGGRVEKNSISISDKTAQIAVGSRAFTVNGQALEFETAPFSRHGHTYVCIEELARALGLDVAVFYQSRLVVFGRADVIGSLECAVKKNPALEFAGAAAVIGEYDAGAFTSEDFRIAKDKWRQSLAPLPCDIDLSDEGVVEKLEAINSASKTLWDEMNRGADRVILWGDAPPTESCDLRFQYTKLYTMTLAWATFGCELYKNPQLEADILDALLWMYENMYGEAELEGTGWRSINTFNWWDWYVGAIEPLTNTLLLVEDLLTMEQKKKYLKVLEYVLDNWRVTNSQDHCSGRMSVGTKCALLLEDPVRLARSANDYHVMLDVVLAGPGTHTDYCNYQHGFPYNMMYGMSNIDRVLKVGANLAGTPLEFSSPRYYNQFNLFKYMYEAAMYRGRGFICYWGRACSGSERSPGMNVITGILPMIGNYGEEEDAYIKRFVKYSLSSPEQIAMAKKCSLKSYSILKEILEDDTISGENDYECAHAWFSADRATQHRNDYAFCVSMPSYRHPNYESINNANKTGWYMNDGTLYLYTKTDQHEFDGVNFVLNKRLAHRMPGTTVDVRERRAVSVASGWRPPEDKVGCMQFDGKYIVAGMDYRAYNREEDEDKVDVGYGGGSPKFINDLVAKKAYFMFDDECVCLGAGISSTMNSDINTVVEHRRLVKLDGAPSGTDLIIADGKKMPTEPFSTVVDNPSYVMLEDFAGFVFVDAPKVSLAKYMHELDPKLLDNYQTSIPEYARGSRPFFEMMINHGKNPKSDTYAYAVLPYADEEKLKTYARDPDFEIISNTPACQAVKEKTLGITAIVFYEAGECAGIKADRACLVTFFDGGKEFKISVAEPTNRTPEVKITVLRRLALKKADRQVSVECGENTDLTFDTELSAGEAYSATFDIL